MVTLLNPFFDLVGFRKFLWIFYVNNHVTCSCFYFFFFNMCAFILFYCLIALASTPSPQEKWQDWAPLHVPSPGGRKHSVLGDRKCRLLRDCHRSHQQLQKLPSACKLRRVFIMNGLGILSRSFSASIWDDCTFSSFILWCVNLQRLIFQGWNISATWCWAQLATISLGILVGVFMRDVAL